MLHNEELMENLTNTTVYYEPEKSKKEVTKIS